MKPESNRPITIEDLLHLKRAELPPAEFWASFDRELRAKQLAALVEKRPWWQTLPRALLQMSRYRAIFGATAVAVVAFVSIRENEATTSGEQAVAHVDPVAQAGEYIIAAPQETGFASPAAEMVAVSASVVQPVVMAEAAQSSEAETAPDLPQTITVVASQSIAHVADVQSPAGRRIAENLAALQAEEPVKSRSLLAVASGFEVRAMPNRVAIEPLQQMTPPSDTRRSRLLTAMVSMASLESSMRTTERAASRIAEERLYDDQMSRFGARGDRLQVKF